MNAVLDAALGTNQEVELPELFAAHPIPQWIHDADSLCILAVSAAACVQYGWTHDELLGRAVHELCGPTEGERGTAPLHDGLGRHVRRGGEAFDVEVTTIAVKYHGRNARLVLARDVTGRASVERFRGIVGSAIDGICVSDGMGRITYVNRRMEELFHCAPGALAGRHLLDLVAEDHVATARARFEEAAQGRASSYELEARTADGAVLHVRVATAPELDADGRFLGATSWFGDLSETLRVAAELRASHAHMRLLLEGSRDAIFEGGLDGRSVHFASPACEALFGVPPHAFLADPELWRRLVVPEDIPIIDRLVAELRTAGQSEGEYRFRRPDGEYRWAHSRTWTVRDELDRPVALAGAVRDVTERREAEARLRAANAELEERVEQRTHELRELHHDARAFAYTVAHELRAPLRVLEGFATLLRSEPNPGLSADSRLLLEQISETARAMNSIVTGHLSLARLERAELRLVEADTRAIVAEVLREQATSLEGRRVELTVAPLPPARADTALLRQVFSNLLSNAIKYTRAREHPRIEIGARRAGEHTVFFVRDNGMGFDPMHAEGLFSPFRRLHDDVDGTGIGLATVRRIVELHDGRIWAESTLGNGATFAFTLSGA